MLVSREVLRLTEPRDSDVVCSICQDNPVDKHPAEAYPNLVCESCDQRAVNEHGEEPWHGWPPDENPETEEDTVQMAPDRGENPVYIDGEKCWRRYRFGGWVTMKDDHDCDSISEFYEEHR